MSERRSTESATLRTTVLCGDEDVVVVVYERLRLLPHGGWAVLCSSREKQRGRPFLLSVSTWCYNLQLYAETGWKQCDDDGLMVLFVDGVVFQWHLMPMASVHIGEEISVC